MRFFLIACNCAIFINTAVNFDLKDGTIYIKNCIRLTSRTFQRGMTEFLNKLLNIKLDSNDTTAERLKTTIDNSKLQFINNISELYLCVCLAL